MPRASPGRPVSVTVCSTSDSGYVALSGLFVLLGGGGGCGAFLALFFFGFGREYLGWVGAEE